MRVTVLYGGPSAEAEVSRKSGAAAVAALREAGHDVLGSEISPDDLSALESPAEVIFPVLHGAWGESGELQEILEQRRLAFVGSGSTASRLGMDKVASKRAWEAAGLPTPPYVVIDRASGATAWAEVELPCIIKPVDSGSSLDLHLARSEAEATEAAGRVVARHGRALVEKFIAGPELTVGLLEEAPLEPIRIVARGPVFDFAAKYEDAGTEHRFDTGLPASVNAQCRELARRANAVIGARDLGRIDIMLDESHRPYLLEINTLPGFTSRSLLPEAAAHAGIPFPRLVDRLVRRARARGGRG